MVVIPKPFPTVSQVNSEWLAFTCFCELFCSHGFRAELRGVLLIPLIAHILYLLEHPFDFRYRWGRIWVHNAVP